MEHIANPTGFFIGLIFVLAFFWNVAMGEVETRVGAIRFDSQPWVWSLINSLFGTIGFLTCAYSVREITGFEWLVSFGKALTAQSNYHVLIVTYLAGVVLAYALQKFVFRGNR